MKHLTIPAIALMLAALPTSAAAPATPADQPRTLTVTGTGLAKAAPDEANFSTGVVSQAPSAGAALAANGRAMNAVIATLKRAGLPDKAIQTSNLSLNPQYQQCKPNVACAQKVVGYEVSNTVSVTAPLDKAGAVLDALVTSGANQISGIGFSIHDPKPLQAAARADAVKDAIEQANTYAKAAGLTLGPIQSVNGGGGSEPPRPVFKAMMARGFDASTPVAGGEETVSASVTITWFVN